MVEDAVRRFQQIDDIWGLGWTVETLAVATLRTALGEQAFEAALAEVAELVAAGLTNPQIAAKLFLGIRTVQTHLRGIMNKLGVNNRTQVAAHVTRSER